MEAAMERPCVVPEGFPPRCWGFNRVMENSDVAPEVLRSVGGEEPTQVQRMRLV